MKDPLKLRKKILYPTYCVRLALHPQGDMVKGDCYKKAILYVTKWVKNKIPDEEKGILADYPDTDEYKNFRPEELNEIRLRTPADLHIISKENIWDLSLEENYEDYDGEFITNISIEETENEVVFTSMTECRQFVGEETAKAYRPQYVTMLAEDQEILITEYGVPEKYPVSYDPIMINGKSKSDLQDFFDGFINNPNTSLGVLFYPEPEEDEGKELLKEMAKHMMGYFYVVVIEKSLNRFFFEIMPNTDYKDILENNEAVLHLDYIENFENGENLAVSYGSYPVDENILKVLNDTKRQQAKLGRFDMSSVRFLSKLEYESHIEEIKKAYDSHDDKQLIAALEKSINELEAKLSDNNDSLAAVSNRNQELIKKLAQTEGKVNNAEREKERAVKDIERGMQRVSEESEEIKKENTILKERIRSQSEAVEYNKKYIKQIVDAMKLCEGTDDGERYISWVKRFYQDTLILHENAERSIKNDDEKNRNWTTICLATHFLAGFTKNMKEDGVTIEEAGSRSRVLFDPFNMAFEVTRSLTGETKQRYLSDYQINIQAYHDDIDSKYEKATLEYHIRCDGRQDSGWFRIYAYYDKELEKSIIGYMPGHLPTAGYDG